MDITPPGTVIICAPPPPTPLQLNAIAAELFKSKSMNITLDSIFNGTLHSSEYRNPTLLILSQNKNQTILILEPYDSKKRM